MTEARDTEPLYALDARRVACQVFDGEAIVIHFERGHYFSATGSAALLLALLQDGCSAARLADELARSFDLDAERASAGVQAFLEQLTAENLVVTALEAPAVAPHSAPGSVPSTTAYEEPRLVKYTDLEDLLVLDPIHEVMLSGWPPSADRAH